MIFFPFQSLSSIFFHVSTLLILQSFSWQLKHCHLSSFEAVTGPDASMAVKHPPGCELDSINPSLRRLLAHIWLVVTVATCPLSNYSSGASDLLLFCFERPKHLVSIRYFDRSLLNKWYSWSKVPFTVKRPKLLVSILGSRK